MYNNDLADNMAAQIGLVFIIAGVAFKFGAVPFHMWVPDVYHGAPIPITLLIATVPKIAALGMTFRLLVHAFYSMSSAWGFMIITMAILSILFGNIVAIAQTNLKRMLAYSAIAHIGFILIGILYGIEDGYVVALFYTIIYTLMSLGVFAMIMVFSRQGLEAENIQDFKGLAYRSPWLAVVMMILLLSLAGIPPTAGFYAKFLVLKALVEYGHLSLAIFVLLMSVVGAFYYLRVIKVMFFEKPDLGFDEVSTYGLSKTGMVLLSANGIAILVFGVFPAPILKLCMTLH